MTETKMQLVDCRSLGPSRGLIWLTSHTLGLDDLCVRFIINLPQEELESVERICFQVEEAQWFYEDFVRPLDPDLPSLNLRNFCLRIFQHCPLLSQFSSYHHTTAFSEFLAYKTRVPVRGAIMLNHDMDAVVLVKGWKKGANWSFPRGKINKDEPDLECAIREVYEETGYDIHVAGLVEEEENVKYIEVTMREQHMRLYVFRDVPMDTRFEPKTRKEISKVQWYRLSDLPTLKKGKQQGDELAINANRFYMVAPFLTPLKRWIAQQKKLDKQNSGDHMQATDVAVSQVIHEVVAAPQSKDVTMNDQASEMEMLLARLRQSNQSSSTPSIPPPFEPNRATASTGLEINPAGQDTQLVFKTPYPPDERSGIPMTTGVDRKKSDALLALLKGQPAVEQVQIPQTPLEQVIRSPLMPPSPKRHHAPAERDRGAFPLHSSQLSIQSDRAIAQSKPHTNKPTATLPSQLVQPPSGALPQGQRLYPSTSNVIPTQQSNLLAPSNQLAQPGHGLPAPYQRPGDRTVAQESHPAGMPSLIPAANRLPPPKLTSHSSALLNLFKSEQAEHPSSGIRAPEAITAHDAETLSQRQVSPVERGGTSGIDDVSSVAEHETQPKPCLPQYNAPKMAKRIEPEPGPDQYRSAKPTTRSESDQRPRHEESYANDPKVQAAMAALHLLPPAASASRVETAPPRSTHQTALLDLFRKPLEPQPTAKNETKTSLEPPPTPFELSALPSPGHSREPSRDNQPLRARSKGDPSQVHPMTQTKPTRTAMVPRKSPVSATVDGPLNVPQFDMLNVKSTKKPSAITSALPAMSRKSPVRILSRPTQHPIDSGPTTPNGVARTEEITQAPRNTAVPTSAVPVQSTPIAHYQPQILRRPPHLKPSDHDSILSPIDPLPSPKHTLGREKQTQDHKQSLLSLFNSPTPVPKPTPVDPEVLISPKAIESRGQTQFVNVANPAGEAMFPAGLERPRIGSVLSFSGEANAKASTGRQTPRATTTPKERSFLLGYLESVAKGEKR